MCSIYYGLDNKYYLIRMSSGVLVSTVPIYLIEPLLIHKFKNLVNSWYSSLTISEILNFRDLIVSIY